MSEYWKSLPRKFCDACKCWFADNKASIEFHEKGKRHQENVQKRINDIQKRGLKEFKKRKDLENTMDKIEKAALAAYKKDLQNNLEPDSGVELPSEFPTVQPEAKLLPRTEKLQNFKKRKQDKNKLNKKMHDGNSSNASWSTKKWYEAETEDGSKYYWNVETSESCWDAPSEGFVSIEEQAQQSQRSKEDSSANIKLSTKTANISEETDDVSPCNTYGPQLKHDPYGQWVSVEHKVEKPIDLQLPKPSEDVVEAYIIVPRDEPKLKFKEKVIGQLSGSDSNEEVLFKKRKFTGSSKRNARQRTEDD